MKKIHKRTTALSKAQRSPTVVRIRNKRKKLAAMLKKLGREQKTALKKAIKRHKK